MEESVGAIKFLLKIVPVVLKQKFHALLRKFSNHNGLRAAPMFGHIEIIGLSYTLF